MQLLCSYFQMLFSVMCSNLLFKIEAYKKSDIFNTFVNVQCIQLNDWSKSVCFALYLLKVLHRSYLYIQYILVQQVKGAHNVDTIPKLRCGSNIMTIYLYLHTTDLFLKEEICLHVNIAYLLFNRVLCDCPCVNCQ